MKVDQFTEQLSWEQKLPSIGRVVPAMVGLVCFQL